MFLRAEPGRLRLRLSSIRCPGAHGQSVLDLSSTENRVAALENSPRSRVGRLPDVRPNRHLRRVDLGIDEVLGLSTAVRFRVNILIRFDSSYIRLPEFIPRVPT